MSELALKRIHQEKKKRTGSLYLGYTGMIEWPDELFECTWVEELIVSNRYFDHEKNLWIEPISDGPENRLSRIPEKINDLRNLKVFICSGPGRNRWNIRDLPDISGLNQLTKIDLGYNQIKELNGLGNLNSLRQLFLGYNKITKINGLDQLSKLRLLKLNGNQIKKIHGLKNLVNLRILLMGGNSIEHISGLDRLNSLRILKLTNNKIQKIYGLDKIIFLQELQLFGNQINEISGLDKLSSLQQLYLGSNQINEISGLDKLSSLQLLDLNSNQIKEISGLDNLSSLKELYLNNNQIEKISGLDKLSSLQKLYLGSNQINEISGLDKLSSLHKLNLKSNNISKISTMDTFESVQILILFDNPIQNLPVALLGESYNENCKANLISWFRDLARESEENNTIKLFLNGNGNAGKTSLVEALKNGQCKEEPASTHGILISFLDLPDEDNKIRFMIWDFGGQEIYHSTHRLFLSSEAIHLVITDNETENLAEIQTSVSDRITAESMRHLPLGYWLHTVKELSPESSVILLRNKADLHSEIHPTIQSSVGHCDDVELQLSATEGTNIESLRIKIKDQAKKLKDHGFELPASWIRVRDFCLYNLENKRHKKTTKVAFKRFCVQYFDVLPLSFDSLLTFLHHSGALFKNEKYLGETLILDQRWALNAIYKPFERGHIFYRLMRKNSKGTADIDSLFQAFGNLYQKDEKWLFVELMLSCQVCFKTNDRKELSKDSVLVFPIFLADETPEPVNAIWKGKKENAYVFRRSYSYLDYYSIQAILIRLGHKTSLEYIWKYGILIETQEGWFKLVANYKEKSIDIHMERPAVSKWLNTIIQIVDGKYYGKDYLVQEKWCYSKDVTHFHNLDLGSLLFEEYLPNQSKKVNQINNPEEKLPDVPQQLAEINLHLEVLSHGLQEIKEGHKDILNFIDKKHRETVKALTDKLDYLSRELLREMYESFDNNEVTDQEAIKLIEHIQSLIESGQINGFENVNEKLSDPTIGLHAKFKLALPIQLSWLQFEVGGEIKWEDSLPKSWKRFRDKINKVANSSYDKLRNR